MKTPFQICFDLVANPDIQTDKTGYDIDMMRNFREYFEEVFELDNEQYKKWWNRLSTRTDISDDDRWELECYEDSFHLLLNVRDSLRKSGVFK